MAAGQYAASSQVALVFGAAAILKQPRLTGAIRKDYPLACIFGCSTAGEISGTHVSDDSVVVTAVHLEHTQLRSASARSCQSTKPPKA